MVCQIILNRIKHYVSVIIPGAPVSSEIDDENSLTCGLCDRIVNVFFTAIDAGEDPDVIVNRLAILCKDLNIYSERVCRGAVGMVMVRNCLDVKLYFLLLNFD